MNEISKNINKIGRDERGKDEPDFLTEVEINELILALDANKDGVVNEHEFVDTL